MLIRRRTASGLLVAACVLPAMGGSATSDDGTVVPLPRADRETLDRYLGPGVVGKPVAAPPIDDIQEYLGLADHVEWVHRTVHGDDRGKTHIAELTRLQRKDSTSRWKFSDGIKTVLYGEIDDDGNFQSHSTEDHDQGVVSRYDPPEPVILRDMKPGDTRRSKIAVSVFDLSKPDEETHSGSLDLTYTYVGAYEVIVPAGRFEATLFKWHYKGEVGPADVEDVQYIFFAQGVGPVALVDKTDVTALLVYREHSKTARVLVRRKGSRTVDDQLVDLGKNRAPKKKRRVDPNAGNQI